MRYYGYRDWILTLSRTLRIDSETLELKLVDPTAAILALRAGGGPPVHGLGSIQDIADGVYRLLIHMSVLRPYRGGQFERAVLATIEDYTRARGFELSLGPQALNFIAQVDAQRLGSDEIKRSLRAGLVAADSRLIRRSDRAIVASISHSITDPSRELVGPTRYLVRELRGYLAKAGYTIKAPAPLPRLTRAGRIEHCDAEAEDSTPISTSHILTRSIDRVSSSHLALLVSDPRSHGVPVEREWALRLRIPILELRLSRRTHPHQDGPGRVRVVDVNPSRPQHALNRVRDQIAAIAWDVEDQLGCADAFEIKNGVALRRLRAAWETKDDRRRDSIANTLGMSRPYIEGLLSNSTALELASESQRRGLELLLQVPGTSVGPAYARCSEHDLMLLGEAASREGLSGSELIRVVLRAEAGLTKSRLRRKRLDLADARRAILAALADLDSSDQSPGLFRADG